MLVMSDDRAGSAGSGRHGLLWSLRLLIVAGLAIDAYVHWHLAPGFNGRKGSVIPHVSLGQLFRLQDDLALLAIVLVLLVRRRSAAVFALLVAAGGCAAILLCRYVHLRALGPLPDLYDPIWYGEKSLCALADAAAAAAALCYVFALERPAPSPMSAPTPRHDVSQVG